MLINAMALAWPWLKSLTFQSHFPSETTKVTIYSLHPLANCAILESLTIFLDAAIPNQNIGLQPDCNFSTSPLSCLSVNHAPIRDPISVASFLFNFFPNLTDIHSQKNNEHDQLKMWEQVQTFLIFSWTSESRRRNGLWCVMIVSDNLPVSVSFCLRHKQWGAYQVYPLSI
jgi:hypothetical protein